MNGRPLELGDIITVSKGRDDSWVGDVFKVTGLCGSFVVAEKIVTKYGMPDKGRIAFDMRRYEFEALSSDFVRALKGEVNTDGKRETIERR